jgi:uncharacterized membrane protein YvlD (DUF360 family)
MTYFKSLLLNFLTVFFVNHIIPGVEIAYYTKMPHIGGELIWAASLGFANSLIFPALRFFHPKPSHFKIGLISFIISFGSYSIVNLLPIGVKITRGEAFVWCGLIVWFISYLTNHLEFRDYLFKKEKELEEREKKLEEKEKEK